MKAALATYPAAHDGTGAVAERQRPTIDALWVLRETVRRFKAKAREYHEAAAGALLREDDLPEERERKAAAVEAQALIYEFEGEQLAAMLVAVEP